MGKYGLLGKTLGHSVSPKIHELFGLKGYELIEKGETEIEEFFKSGEFDGFNVTIPYKETVIPYLFSLNEVAKEIGAVNTVVKTENGYVGYNTDADGMAFALKNAGISLKGKTVLILGTGGTSKTARFVAKKGEAKNVFVVGRKSEINYDNVYELTETQVIINTTPVGMFPKINETPLDVTRFNNLDSLFDCIYNPKETLLVKTAKENGATASNGLYMLAEQARIAEEKFFGKTPFSVTTKEVVDSLLKVFS